MFEKKFASVLGKRMAYIEEGEGDPIVFLHGNPTSSFLWRKVIPALAGRGRCLAPDLIGMGDSQKLADSGPGSYRFVEHRRYLDALLQHLEVTERVTLVVHDWGSALGFDWAYRHQDAVAGIVYMEALIGPISWDDWPETARSIFRGFRSEAGEGLVLEKNYFVERVLPASVLDPLPSDVMDEHRRPFLEPGESRRPTLTWPREIPIDGFPADVHEIASAYNAWLRTTPIPKLFVNAEPGFFSPGIAEATEDWPNQEMVTVRGHHFVQEDSGVAIGQAIADWLRRRETLAK
ncbi:MAG: haloalkane dehalogenase [Acidimicrobiia bacterium]